MPILRQDACHHASSTIRHIILNTRFACCCHSFRNVTNGVGRFVRALVQGPIDISVNLTRGVHNIAKLWGDDTVRPRSGAVRREFGFDFYDTITGLDIQSVKGVRERGAGGFVTGVGKGVTGFVLKMGAACLGILSHTLQGASKKVQKLFANDVQSYIVASRAAQGYEEWLHSSEAEKRDIITKRKLIQKSSKGEEKAEVPNQDDAIEQDPSSESGLDQESRKSPVGPAETVSRTQDSMGGINFLTPASNSLNLSLRDLAIAGTPPTRAYSGESLSTGSQASRSLDLR